MTTTTKMTQKVLFETLLTLPDVQARPDLVAGLTHRLDVLAGAKASKAGKTRKPDPAVEARKDAVLRVLADGVSRPCKDIASLAGVTVGQCSGALTSLKGVGKVKREVRKGVAFFSLATPSEE